MHAIIIPSRVFEIDVCNLVGKGHQLAQFSPPVKSTFCFSCREAVKALRTSKPRSKAEVTQRRQVMQSKKLFGQCHGEEGAGCIASVAKVERVSCRYVTI